MNILRRELPDTDRSGDVGPIAAGAAIYGILVLSLSPLNPSLMIARPSAIGETAQAISGTGTYSSGSWAFPGPRVVIFNASGLRFYGKEVVFYTRSILELKPRNGPLHWMRGLL